MASCLRAESHVRSRAGTGPPWGEGGVQAEAGLWEGLWDAGERPSSGWGGVRWSWPWGRFSHRPCSGPLVPGGVCQSTGPAGLSLPPGEGQREKSRIDGEGRSQ